MFSASEDADKHKDNKEDLNHLHDNKIDEFKDNKNNKCSNNKYNSGNREDSNYVVKNLIN